MLGGCEDSSCKEFGQEPSQRQFSPVPNHFLSVISQTRREAEYDQVLKEITLISKALRSQLESTRMRSRQAKAFCFIIGDGVNIFHGSAKVLA